MRPTSLIPAFVDAVARLQERVPYASAFARSNAGTSARVSALSTVCQPISPQAGFTLSAWTGERFLEISSDRLDPAAVAQAAIRLLERLRALPRPIDPITIDPGPQLDRRFSQDMQHDSRLIPAAEKVAFASALRKRLMDASPRMIEATGIIADVHAEIYFVNPSCQLAQELHRIREMALGTFSDGAHQAELHGGFERIGGWEHRTLEHRFIEDLRHDGPRLLGAGRLPDPGEHDCIFSGDFSGMFAHEAFGHGTEQDMFLKDRAKGAEFLGKPVASPLVEMIDDPANGWAASYFFDDEGVLATPTRIISQGVLVNGINDRYSAAVLNRRGLTVAKTANGRREAYDHKPYTRMTNTYFGRGIATFAEMLRTISHGYYLTHPSNGMEDPKGWGIQLEGAMAEEIEDGRLTGRVFSPVVVTGSVPKLLQSVSQVGDEVVEASLGMCGKGYKEWVKVTDGGPVMRLRAVLA